jgi:hypothetical protein
MYEPVVEPQFRQQQGRKPQDRHEVRQAMVQKPYYQFWSALQRRSQEMIWDATLDPLDRQQQKLVARSRELGPDNPQRLGSLQLNPDLPMPRYLSAADIHLQPGGYHTDRCDDDVTAGALYETGLQIYLASELLARAQLEQFTPDPQADDECQVERQRLVDRLLQVVVAELEEAQGDFPQSRETLVEELARE